MPTSNNHDAHAGPRHGSVEEIPFLYSLLPVLTLGLLVTFGLIVRPQFLGLRPFPLEMVFVLASIVAVAELSWLGFRWSTIQSSVVKKLAKALPAFFVLFSIGLIISSWMVSGTIAMLVYYGIELIHPSFLYFFALLVPAIFSTLTGTSWGSAGTVGVVIMGIASALDANLGVTAGAIIGGSYFGDKMSPLSDTTNLAALASDVDLFDHIRSMMVTTAPSAALAAVIFLVVGFLSPPGTSAAELADVARFQESLREMFEFNVLLLLPPVIILVGSFRRMPTIPTLLGSVLMASVLAIIFQPFTVADVLQSLNRGFDTDMVVWVENIPQQTTTLVNRGGLYSMSEAIFVAFLIFFFIGAIDTIDAMRTVVNRVIGFATTRATTILAALGATALTNAMTSNQYATSFIVGEAMSSRFDALRIPRKVLSRSLEDTGTMLESVIPWSATAVFMVATLGVPWEQYWNWQLVSLINFVIAPTLAVLGIGCFYDEVDAVI